MYFIINSKNPKDKVVKKNDALTDFQYFLNLALPEENCFSIYFPIFSSIEMQWMLSFST